jgi:hypothetical protein
VLTYLCTETNSPHFLVYNIILNMFISTVGNGIAMQFHTYSKDGNVALYTVFVLKVPRVDL